MTGITNRRPTRIVRSVAQPGYAFDGWFPSSPEGLAEGFVRVRGQTGNYEKFWGDTLPGEPGEPEGEGVYEHGTLEWLSDEPITWQQQHQQPQAVHGSRWFVRSHYECVPQDSHCQGTGSPRQTWFIEHPPVVTHTLKTRVFFFDGGKPQSFDWIELYPPSARRQTGAARRIVG